MFGRATIRLGIGPHSSCVLKAGVIKWPMKLYVRFYVFLNQKNVTLRLFELLHTFSPTLETHLFSRCYPAVKPEK